MSNTVTPSFIAQYGTELKLAFQQKTSKLLDNVTAHRNVTGSTYNFHKMATITANTKGRGLDVTGLDPVSAQVTCTLTDAYAPVYLDKLDELKTNANIRQGYIASSAAALARSVDATIITALSAATTTTTTQTGALTIAKILEALAVLNLNEVDPDGRVLLISPQQLSDALAINQLTSADYMSFQAIMQAGIGTAYGFTWVVMNGLPLSVKNRTCFAFNKKAIGVAIGQDITTAVDWIPEKVATLVNSYVSLGSVIIENAGVAKIICVEP